MRVHEVMRLAAAFANLTIFIVIVWCAVTLLGKSVRYFEVAGGIAWLRAMLGLATTPPALISTLVDISTPARLWNFVLSWFSLVGGLCFLWMSLLGARNIWNAMARIAHRFSHHA